MAKIATPQVKNGIRKSTDTRTSATRQATTARSINSATQAEIEKIAYQFYVERGYADGFHEQDWLRAEAIVLSRSRS